MTSRRPDDAARIIAKLQRRLDDLWNRASRRGHGHTVGYVDRQFNVATASTSLVDITGLSVTVDVKAGCRYRIILYTPNVTHSGGSGNRAQVTVTDGSNTQIQVRNLGFVSTQGEAGGTLVGYDVPSSSGSKIYKGRMRAISPGTVELVASSEALITLTVEDMGTA